MLITFSEPFLKIVEGSTFRTLADRVEGTTRITAECPHYQLTWDNGAEVRFTLPGATTAQHEAVIAALLELDPNATIRTSRAMYRGREDYRRQKLSTA